LGEMRTKIFLQKGLDRLLAKQPADLPVGLIVSKARKEAARRKLTE